MTAHQYSYGSFDNSNEPCEVNGMPDIERTASRGENSPLMLGNTREKDIAMRPLLDQASDRESIISEESYESAQAGVKRLEAISSTWTKRDLYVAYLGYVHLYSSVRNHRM